MREESCIFSCSFSESCLCFQSVRVAHSVLILLVVMAGSRQVGTASRTRFSSAVTSRDSHSPPLLLCLHPCPLLFIPKLSTQIWIDWKRGRPTVLHAACRFRLNFLSLFHCLIQYQREWFCLQLVNSAAYWRSERGRAVWCHISIFNFKTWHTAPWQCVKESFCLEGRPKTW